MVLYLVAVGKQAQPDECMVSDQCAVACRFGLTSVSYNSELDSQLHDPRKFQLRRMWFEAVGCRHEVVRSGLP